MTETKHHTVQVGKIRLGHGEPLFLIAGPCVIEDEAMTLRHASRLKEIAAKAGIPFIFKSSYDKANRMSGSSFRGPGLRKGLEILQKVKDRVRVPVLSDVHTEDEAVEAAQVLDVLQIPAFLARQTDLAVACAQTGKPVNIKKGQFLAPWDMKPLIEKVVAHGKNSRVLITERGFSFGYNNLVSDMRSIPIMQAFGYPVIFDAGHSVQLPGGKGTSSGGMREMIPVLARAAVAAGCDGLFVEVHENPDRAPSDGPNMLKVSELPTLLKRLKAIRAALNGA